MKTTTLRATLLLLAGSMLALPSIASNADPYQLSYNGEQVAKQLYNLTESQPQDACSGDVFVAAAYIDAASLKIKNGQFKLALTSIGYGENELRAISMYRSYCQNFSSLVKPYLAKVITIASYLDRLEYPNQN